LDVGAILAVVGLAAVGIERFLEGAWSVVDTCLGGFWPLNEVAKQIEGEIDALGQPLKPFTEQFDKLLDQANSAVGTLSADQIKKAQDELNKSFDQLKKVAARSGSSELFATGMAQKLRDLQKNYPLDNNKIDTILKTMKDSTGDVQKFVQSFKDNPGRRLVSLYIGTLLGLTVAWALGLDLLATLLKAGQSHSVALGIIMAGVVMGLGSSPAHEIVQAILNWRKTFT
jgi:hypothetical protein